MTCSMGVIMVHLPHQKGLDINILSRVFHSTTNSYKFFWFWSVIDEVRLGHTVIPMEQLACRMIVKCWYYVRQNTLGFSVKDQLPNITEYAINLIGIDNTYDDEEFLVQLIKNDDPMMIKKIRTLCKYVPYRLLTPFFTLKGIPDHKKNQVIIELANDHPNCLYSFIDSHDLIRINELWIDYILQNSTIIVNWIKFKITEYLQDTPCKIVVTPQNKPQLKEKHVEMDIEKYNIQFLQNFVIRTVMFIESTMGPIANLHQNTQCSFQQVVELEEIIAEVYSWDETISYDSDYYELFQKKTSIVESYKKAILYAYCLDTDDDELTPSFSECHINEFIEKVFYRIAYVRGDLLSILQQALEKSEAGSILYKKKGDSYIPYICISNSHLSQEEEEEYEVVEELSLKVEMELRLFLRQRIFTLLEEQDRPIQCKDLLQLFNLECSEGDKFRFFLSCNIRGEASILFRLLNKRLSSNLDALKDFIDSEQQYFFIIGEEVVALREWKKDKKVFNTYVEILERYFNEGYQVVEVLENVVQILKEEEKLREKRYRSNIE